MTSLSYSTWEVLYGAVSLWGGLTHFELSTAVPSWQGQKAGAVYHPATSPASWDEYISYEQTLPDIYWSSIIAINPCPLSNATLQSSLELATNAMCSTVQEEWLFPQFPYSALKQWTFANFNMSHVNNVEGLVLWGFISFVGFTESICITDKFTDLYFGNGHSLCDFILLLGCPRPCLLLEHSGYYARGPRKKTNSRGN